MALRRKAREYALQMLFQWEMGRQAPGTIESGFWKSARAEKNTPAFANQLFQGVVAQAAALDELVGKDAENWRAERMAATDHASPRLAACALRAGGRPP